MDDNDYILEFYNPQTNEEEQLSGPLLEDIVFPNDFVNPLFSLLKLYPVKQNGKTGTADIFRVELDFDSDSIDSVVSVLIQVVNSGVPSAKRVCPTNFSSHTVTYYI